MMKSKRLARFFCKNKFTVASPPICPLVSGRAGLPENVTVGLPVISTNNRVRNCSRRRNTCVRLYGLPGFSPK